MKKIKSAFLQYVLLLVLILNSSNVFAALGESAASVSADSKALSARQLTTTMRSGYTIQVIESDSTTVREYIGPSGIVFGIAWNGLVHPDLTRLMGSYTGEYTRAMKQTSLIPGSRRHRLNTGRLVVEKWGHMRNLQGRAYVPVLLPSGVKSDEIR